MDRVRNSIALQKQDYLRQVKQQRMEEIAKKNQLKRMLLWYGTVLSLMATLKKARANVDQVRNLKL
jgi:hypothetical protein